MGEAGAAGRSAWEGEMFRLLAENVLDYAIFVVGPDRHILSWSPGAERLLGFTEAEIVGKPCDRFFVPEDAAAGVPQKELGEALATGRGDDDRWHVRKDGTRFWASGTVTPLRDEGGTLRGFAKIMRDRTAMKRAADAAHEPGRRRNLLTDHASVLIAHVDPDRRYKFVNKPYAAHFGLHPREVVGRPVRDVLGGPAYAAVERHMDAALAGERVEFEAELPSGGPGRQTVRCAYDPEVDDAGRVRGFVAALVNVTEARRAGDALRESEERFARFMHHLPGLAWVKDADGRYVYANAAAATAFGRPAGELYGRTDAEVFPPDTARQFRENDRKALDAGAGVRTVETLEHPGGVVRHSLVSKFPIPGPDGEPPLVGGVAVDITDEMRTRAVLEESEERFRATFDQAAVGIAHVGTDGRWLRVNRKLCDIVGYAPDELMGRTFQDVTHPDDVDADLAQLRRLVAGEIDTYAMEKRYFRKDGRTVWVNLTVALVRTPAGTPKYLISVVEDITARKAVEDALRDSERRYRTLFDNMAEEVHYWRVERDGAGRILTWRLVDANPPALKTWGRSLDDIRGRTTDEIFGPGSTDHYRAVVEKVMAEGVPHAYEDYFPNLDRHFRFTTVPVGGHFITTGADITAVKKAHEALRESESRLRTLSDNLPDGAVYQTAATPDGGRRFVYVSAGIERVFGVTPAEAMADATALYGLVHADDRDRLAAAEAVALRDLTPFDCEFRSHARGGGVRWVHCRSAPRRLPDGAVAWEGIVMDVTARRRSEREAEVHRGRLDLVVNSVDVGLWYCDLPFDRLVWNAKVKEHFGLPADADVTIDTFYERLHPDDRDRTRAAIAASIRDRTGYDIEYRTVGPGGRERWVRAIGRTFYGPTGEPTRFDGITVDVTDRVRAGEELRRRAEEVETLMEFMPIAVIRADDPACHRLTGNPAAHRLLGVPVGSGLSKSPPPGHPGPAYRTLRDGAEVPHDRLPMQTACRTGVEVRDAEYEIAFDGGVSRQILCYATPLSDGAGGVRGCVFAALDVTDRKRDEERLRASEERFRTLFETMDEGFCVVEVAFDAAGRAADYRVAEMNPAFAKHTGMGGLAGRWVREAVPGLEEFWFDTYGRVAATGEPTRFAHRAGPMGGRWFDVSAFRLGGAGSNRVAILFNDISDRKRAEEAVRESERRFREMADTAPVALWTTDPDGQCTFLSREWYEFTGQTEAEALGLGWTDATHPDDAADAGRRFLAANAARTTFRTEYRVRTRAGSYRWAMDYGRPRHSAGGEYLGMVGAVFDLEDRKQAEQALRDADRRKDEFLATLAHELRNPLAPIRNGLQVMKLAAGDPGAVAKARSMMERQLGQMVHLIDDLLDVSRITRGKLHLRRERVDLAVVVQSAIEATRPLVEASAHRLDVALPPGPVWLDADPTRLAQVLSNLLTNAAKYAERGGHIWLAAGREGGQVVVSVKDTGIGIAPEHLPRVFEMFSQVASALDRSQGGLGIGLSLVKGLVEMHGGTVEARSGGLGRGSEFVVRLPAADGPAVPKAAAGRAAGGSGRRVLVADDNRDAADSLAMLLQLGGHEVHTAHDGLAAVEAAGRVRPDVAVLDIGMPGLTGYDAARRIRAEPWGRGVVLVALTGWGQEDDKRRAADAGFDRHLTKPVDPAELDGLLASLPPGPA